MLRFLIQSKATSQTEVAANAGIAESTMSEILAGKREMNRKHIESLVRYFRVSPVQPPDRRVNHNETTMMLFDGRTPDGALCRR